MDAGPFIKRAVCGMVSHPFSPQVVRIKSRDTTGAIATLPVPPGLHRLLSGARLKPLYLWLQKR